MTGSSLFIRLSDPRRSFPFVDAHGGVVTAGSLALAVLFLRSTTFPFGAATGSDCGVWDILPEVRSRFWSKVSAPFCPGL